MFNNVRVLNHDDQDTYTLLQLRFRVGSVRKLCITSVNHKYVRRQRGYKIILASKRTYVAMLLQMKLESFKKFPTRLESQGLKIRRSVVVIFRKLIPKFRVTLTWKGLLKNKY